MAAVESSSSSEPPPIGSTETALCILPPAHLCRDVDRLRMLYDKAYGKWPAHINLIYPFVAARNLPRAAELAQSTIASFRLDSKLQNIRVRLDETGHFNQHHSSTIYVTDGGAEGSGIKELERLRKTILEAFKSTNDTYHPHLTIGQCRNKGTLQHKHLLEKAGLLPPFEWQVSEIVILIREKIQDQEGITRRMKIWGAINLEGDFLWSPTPGEVEEQSLTDAASTLPSGPVSTNDQQKAQLDTTFQFCEPSGLWKPYEPSYSGPGQGAMPNTLTVSSYNVLVDSIFPSRQERYSLLLRAILSKSALADILVLQEVSDDFLSYILADEIIRAQYPFVTHGPPNQSGIGPLTSLCNIVVLSRWGFSWKYVPFQRRHKGAVVLTMETIGEYKGTELFPLVIAGVHLTCGLTDGAVAAKKSQVQTVVNYLSRNHSENSWIVAGDFNITTSTVTIEAAVKSKSISSQTADRLGMLEKLLADAQLSDSWFVARTEAGDTTGLGLERMNSDDVREGEEGATFDPKANKLAAEIVGGGFSHRPQRYDRILVKGNNLLITRFNMFGSVENSCEETYDLSPLEGPGPYYGSDHWGIRTLLKINKDRARDLEDIDMSQMQLRKAPSRLSGPAGFRPCLEKQFLPPSDEDIDRRKEIMALVKDILQQSPTSGDEDTASHIRANISTVVVPVGSYGLGVWDASSDIDCLCVGSISTKLFFTLAGQRLGKAADQGIRILRKVTASSGTMMEVDIKGVKVDLQYCPAAQIAERWPTVFQLPESDPAFYLPIQTLGKLAPFRDLDYLQRTIPDLATFRRAHRFVKAWATQRGIYSSKFGYLGGIHITLMLSRVCKLLFREAGTLSAADVVCTFFNHYADFDWKSKMVFDPFFYKQQPRPHQSGREPIVVLGLHAPRINVAHTASPPSARTVIGELKRADSLLSDHRVTWSELIGDSSGVEGLPGATYEFLNSYNSYIKINVQYWGNSLSKGALLVGWLESRCVPLLVDLNRKFPDIHARIWPARFADRYSANDKDEGEYQGCYLIGLSKREDSGKLPKSESDRKSAHGVLQSTLETFAERIRGDEKYFDAAWSWVDVSLVKKSELRYLKLDDSEWGDYMAQEYESDSDEEDEESLEFDDEDDEEVTGKTKASAKSKKSSSTITTSGPAAARKLRPATDILNRLRWDPNMDSSDYIIGYDDRFLGVREIGLDKWKTEQTDEEFIPQHRILYFRRKKDGVVVWDREARKDAIYGSGAGGEQG